MLLLEMFEAVWNESIVKFSQWISHKQLKSSNFWTKMNKDWIHYRVDFVCNVVESTCSIIQTE